MNLNFSNFFVIYKWSKCEELKAVVQTVYLLSGANH